MRECSSHTTEAWQESRPGSLHLREVWRGRDLRLHLELWPSRLYALPVALFTILWLRFLWRWYSLVLLSSVESSRGFLFLFGLPFLLAGVSLVGTSIRLVLGRTLITLDALRFFVGEQTLVGARAPSLLLPTARVVDFVAECASPPDDARELDAWHVQVRLSDGASAILPLPVRTLVEADHITQRLNRALDAVRQPTGYRDLL